MKGNDERGRRFTAGLAVLSLVLGTLLIALATTTAPAAAAAPTDGPLLYSGFLSGTLKTLTGTSTALGFPVAPVAAFAPDGKSIASAQVSCTDLMCNTSNTVVTLRHVDGTSAKLADLAGDVQDIGWSSDGSQIVALTGYTNSEIWRIGVDGSAPVKVLGTTSAFRVEGDGLDWSPTADTIAFIGTPLNADGSSLSKDTQQVYTIAATGGAPAQYSQVLPDCAFPSCTLVSYSHPSFAPDGNSIAAFVDRDVENYDTPSHTVEEFVGTLTAGQLSTKVRSILSLTNPSTWSFLAIDGPVWSSDSTRLLYSQYDDQSTNTRTARVVNVADGTVTSVSDPQFRDWQPCPTGTCPVFPAPSTVPKAPVIGTASSGAIGGSVTATARWTPGPNGGSPITSFTVQAVRVSSTGAVLSRRNFVRSAAARSATLSLARGRYKFRVSAANVHGSGLWSRYSNIVTAR